MKKEYIIFDTNYINRIIDENNKYLNILNDLKNDYFFTINIGTFVEIMKKIINNQNKFKEVISLFEDYQFFIGEFENYKCIKVPNFSFQKFMEMTKKDRKKLFNEIYNNYYNFVCKFITFFLEYTLYALVLLITEDLKENKAYKKYLNLKSKEFHKEFLKCYCEKKELRIKDKFNIIVFRELKKIKHSDFNVNKDLLNSILNNYNETNLMNIFEATKKEEKL